jgi:hypothetical protein
LDIALVMTAICVLSHRWLRLLTATRLAWPDPRWTATLTTFAGLLLGVFVTLSSVGAGNAATCAALSVHENGARVLMLEIAPKEARGGNSAFTGGAFRVVYYRAEDLARLIPDMNETESPRCRFRHLHRGAVFRRYGPADPVPLRPGHDRDLDPQQL